MFKSEIVKGLFFAFAGFLLFSLGDAAAKYLSQRYAVPEILFWAQIYALAGLFTLALIKHDRILDMYKTRNLKLHLTRGSILGGQVFFTFYAFSQLSLAQAYTFIFTAPLFATLITTLWLKEKTSLLSWVILLIGFSGILVILRPGFSTISPGHISALLAGIIFALGYVIGRRIGSEPSPLTLGIYPASCTFVFAMIYMILTNTSLAPPPLPDTGFMIFLGLSSVGGILFLSWAFNLAPVPAVSSFHYTQILWGTLLGYIFFGDSLDMWTAIGAVLIIGSGLALNLRIGRGRVAKAKPVS